MAKKQTPAKGSALVVQKAKPAPASTVVDVALKPKHLKAAIAFRDKALQIVIGDAASHTGALTQSLEGKKLKRLMLADWKIPIGAVSAVLDGLRELRKAEETAIDAGLDVLETRIVAWVNKEKARAAEAERVDREAREKEANEQREKDLRKQEREAEKLEAQSPDLSAREQKFVDVMVQFDGSTLIQDPTKLPELAAVRAGYKDPETKGAQLLTVAKIVKAIDLAKRAKAIREQAEALREEPINVTAASVAADLGYAAGARMTKTHRCGEVIDLAKFRAAYIAGQIPIEAMLPDRKFLNGMAKALETKFEQAYPGCVLETDEGVAG